MNTLFSALVSMAVLLSAGCQATQVRRSTIEFRDSLLDVYVEQAMDNLIRARRNEPFVQLSFRDLLVQDTDEVAGAASTMQTSESVIGGLREITKVWTIGGDASRSVILSYKADPVTDENDIYELYLAFARDPYLFRVSEAKPTCDCHMIRRRCGLYYFVPCEAAHEFQQLVLQTSFLRESSDKDPLDEYFLRRTITRVEENQSDQGAEEVQHEEVPQDETEELPPGESDEAIIEGFSVSPQYYVYFDRLVPNSDDTVVFVTIGNSRQRLSLEALDCDDVLANDSAFGGIGATNRLVLKYDSVSNFDPKDLEGEEALIVSLDVPITEASSREEKADLRIQGSLRSIEANVLNQDR